MPRNYLLQNCSELWRFKVVRVVDDANRDWLKICGPSRSEKIKFKCYPLGVLAKNYGLHQQ